MGMPSSRLPLCRTGRELCGRKAAHTSPGSSSHVVQGACCCLGERSRSQLSRVLHLVLLLPALACFGLRGALWCALSARSIATVRRSCHKTCLSRRCRLRMGTLNAVDIHYGNSQEMGTLARNKLGCCGCCDCFGGFGTVRSEGVCPHNLCSACNPESHN